MARFEFGYMAARRDRRPARPPPRAETLMPRVSSPPSTPLGAGGPLVIGGKSMGGRVASMVADELHAAGRIAGPALPRLPVPPAGPAGAAAHRAPRALATPALICQGTRDPFGTREEVAGYALSPAIEILWLEDGDHDLRPRKARVRRSAGRRPPARPSAERPSAAWARGLPG